MNAQEATIARGPHGETAEYVFVTPDMAAGWLKLNVEKNRNVKKSRINGYVRDIQSDNWVLTGEAIKFDVDGRLIDGQNRCQEVIGRLKHIQLTVITNWYLRSMSTLCALLLTPRLAMRMLWFLYLL